MTMNEHMNSNTKPSLRVAVADDEPLIRRWFQDVLPDLGHQAIVVASNGRQLVEGCRAAKPDLVISDIKMPEMDGIEAALAISQQCPAPIILVSAFHDEDLIERASASHVTWRPPSPWPIAATSKSSRCKAKPSSSSSRWRTARRSKKPKAC
jgi:CheY-like chemotaxis protein